MQTPTARLLELLELLQARPLTTGREIAEQLEIDSRTVRRYIAALQALEIPVEGQRGVGGGYRVRPGYRLPPLMLSDDEAVVVVLGLIAARRQGLDSDSGSVDGALAKIHRVLPDPLRRRVEALEKEEWEPVQPSESDSVKVMTIHQAKGLEFDQVFVPGVAENLLPSRRIQQNPAERGYSLDFELRGDAATVSAPCQLAEHATSMRAESRPQGASWSRGKIADGIDAKPVQLLCGRITHSPHCLHR